jgi:Xaa-Pro aminopeptidase
MSSSPKERLTALRTELQRQTLDGFLIPRSDEHLGEYVPASAERLAFISGFTGSAGLAVVLPDRAALFTDGRYVLQAEQETDPALWERHHLIEDPPHKWLPTAAPTARIGYDPWLLAEQSLERFRDAGVALVAVSENPLDAIWTDRPAPPAGPIFAQPLACAGETSAAKRAALAKTLVEAGEDAAILSDPASIAWLLNIRGRDVPFTPFALSFAILTADGACQLFIDPARVPPAVLETWDDQITVAPRASLAAALASFATRRVRVDGAGTAAWFAEQLRAAGAQVVAGADPCLLPKACKNPVEQQGARDAHRRDAVALCRFLHWLAENAATGRETELGAAQRLLDFRCEINGFEGESFPAISGAGPHGAIIHYRVSPASSRPINANEVYLIDSGAQYPDGTTDVTRTIWTGPEPAPAELRARATAVLQGHIAIATLCFPQGVAGPHIDALARTALWRLGLDYDHGTGHGVGSYLSVHEGPAGISRAARPIPLAPGMILSDEPGFYLSGAYGIRLENLLLVQPAPDLSATRPFLRFETLTLAPFDTTLIDVALLTPAERTWLNTYHARVLADVGPHLSGSAKTWLEAACQPK